MRPEALEAAMTVAPMVGPTARLANRGLMATGRAGEQLAERVVPQIMERGGLPAEIMQGMSRGTVSPLDVYHGSPYRFPPTARNPLGEFDASKIGTGEGAQVYGRGIYTAEAPAVARGYADRLGANYISIDGKPMDFNDPVHIAASIISDPNNAGLPGKQLANAIRYDPKGIVPYGAESKVEEIAKALESGNLPKFTNQKGNFYKADLPDEKIAKMLDWDTPLNEQPKQIQESIRILTKQAKEDAANPNAMYGMATSSDGTSKRISPEIINSMDGAAIHEMLQKVYGNDLSNKLNALGIPGIKYLDQNSRQPGIASMTQAQLDTRINILKKDIDSGLGDQERMKQILSSMEQERALHTNLTRNFVVFPGEEKSMRILERNGETAASPFYQDPFMDTTR
jgi:hypothetical protein